MSGLQVDKGAKGSVRTFEHLCSSYIFLGVKDLAPSDLKHDSMTHLRLIGSLRTSGIEDPTQTVRMWLLFHFLSKLWYLETKLYQLI